MVELATVLGYALTLGIPMLVMGYGSMVNATRSASILALINFFALLFYFNHTGDIAGWVMALLILMISVVLGVLIKSTITGGNN